MFKAKRDELGDKAAPIPHWILHDLRRRPPIRAEHWAVSDARNRA